MDNNHEQATRINMAAPMYGPTQARKTFVLCFDGTGNVFTFSTNRREFGAKDSATIEIFRNRQ